MNDEILGAGMERERGRSDVHAEINLHPSKGHGMSGRLEDDRGPVDRTLERLASTRDRATDALRGRMEDLGDGARARGADASRRMRARFAEVRDDASGRAADIRDRGARMMNDSGARDVLGRYPLASVALAFGAGFLLAGSGSGRKAGIRFKAKQQLRGALMAAATAAAVQQGRSLLGMSSGDNGIGSLFGSDERPTRGKRQHPEHSATVGGDPVPHPD